MPDLPEDRKQQIREEEEARLRAEAEYRESVRKELADQAPPTTETAPPVASGPPPVDVPPPPVSVPPIEEVAPPPSAPPIEAAEPPMSVPPVPEVPPVAETGPPPAIQPVPIPVEPPRPPRVRKTSDGKPFVIIACLLMIVGLAGAGFGFYLWKSTPRENVYEAKAPGEMRPADFTFQAPVPTEPSDPPITATTPDPMLIEPDLPPSEEPTAFPTPLPSGYDPANPPPIITVRPTPDPTPDPAIPSGDHE